MMAGVAGITNNVSRLPPHFLPFVGFLNLADGMRQNCCRATI